MRNCKHTQRILKLLSQLIKEDERNTQENISNVLKELFELYHDGLYFLNYFCYVYIFKGFNNNPTKLSKAEIRKFQTTLSFEAKKIMNSLINNRIRILGEFEYSDERNEDEKHAPTGPYEPFNAKSAV